MNELILAAGWGVAGGLAVALIVSLWVLNAVLSLVRRTMPRLPPANESAGVTELQRGGYRATT